MWKSRFALAFAALTAAAFAGVLTAQPAQAETSAAAAPGFQLPFPCGQTWNGDSDNSSAHRAWEIDFNRGGSATADLKDTVVAAAAGTVQTAAHQGSANGYGNLVKIKHDSTGYYTYYAHLNNLAVKAGEYVSQGQVIGTLGNTSKPGNGISPHLHYEVRVDGTYPGNIRKAVFNGSTFGYPNANVASRNCANSYDPSEVCGSGFYQIDSARLGAKGTVDLAWNGGSNCVVTRKFASVGTASATSAYLEPQGASRSTDSGNFTHYAGPVKAASPNCVKWGGAVEGTAYNSPSEHC